MSRKAPKSQAIVVKDNAFEGMSTKDALAYWIALPMQHRNPDTQKKLASVLQVSEERLSQIKREPEFQQQVMEYRKTFFKQFTSDIIEALAKTAKSGNERAAKLFLQYIEDFTESSKQIIDKTETRKFVFQLSQERLEKLRGELKELKRLRSGEYTDAEVVSDEKVPGTPES